MTKAASRGLTMTLVPVREVWRAGMPAAGGVSVAQAVVGPPVVGAHAAHDLTTWGVGMNTSWRKPPPMNCWPPASRRRTKTPTLNTSRASRPRPIGSRRPPSTRCGRTGGSTETRRPPSCWVPADRGPAFRVPVRRLGGERARELLEVSVEAQVPFAAVARPGRPPVANDPASVLLFCSGVPLLAVLLVVVAAQVERQVGREDQLETPVERAVLGGRIDVDAAPIGRLHDQVAVGLEVVPFEHESERPLDVRDDAVDVRVLWLP